MSHNANPPSMDCEAVVRALWDYLDGRCEPDRHGLIDEHLELCESCRSHAEFERALLDKLAESGRGKPDPEELHRRVERAIREAAARGEGGGEG